MGAEEERSADSAETRFRVLCRLFTLLGLRNLRERSGSAATTRWPNPRDGVVPHATSQQVGPSQGQSEVSLEAL